MALALKKVWDLISLVSSFLRATAALSHGRTCKLCMTECLAQGLVSLYTDMMSPLEVLWFVTNHHHHPGRHSSLFTGSVVLLSLRTERTRAQGAPLSYETINLTCQMERLHNSMDLFNLSSLEKNAIQF